MGHFGAIDEQIAITDETSVYGCYKNHFSLRQSNTKLIVIESLRRLHPDQHITEVQKGQTSLLNYAQAGHAEAKLVRDGNELLSRSYTPPRSRMESGDGTLRENITFGMYDYTWNSHTYRVYDIGWPIPGGQIEAYFYVLTDKSEVDSENQSPKADALIKAAGKWNVALHDEVYVFDNGGWRKNRELWKSVQSASWNDVILDPAMKDTLITDVENFFNSRAIYEQYAVPWKRGIIFHGTPGCGKTISIKALMNAMEKKNVASLYVKSFTASQGMQHSIRMIFQKARLTAPCMLIFEDLDSLVVDDVRSYFLNEVDGVEDNNGILMIGSTNHLEKLDPAISKRPSRFDRKYHYRLPGEHERILYCQYWRSKLQQNSKIDFDDDMCRVVAQLTEGFSFAYLKELFVQTLLAVVSNHVPMDEDDDWEVAVTDAAAESKIVEGSGSVVKGDEAVTTGGAVEEDGNEEEHKKDKPKRVMPEVEMPEHLQTNALMLILLKQAKALWKDMDNTTDEIHSRAKVE